MKDPNRITFQAPPSSVRFEPTQAATPTATFVTPVESQQAMCGQRCPNCNKPCRGYAGHALPHQCNMFHNW